MITSWYLIYRTFNIVATASLMGPRLIKIISKTENKTDIKWILHLKNIVSKAKMQKQ